MARQSDSPQPSRAPRVRVKKRRQEILDAAAQVFYEKGYEAASTQDIADKVGILKGSLYYYVESKEEFLFEVIKEAHSLSLEFMAGVRDEKGGGRAKIERLIHDHLQFYVQNRVKATVFFREYPILTAERRGEIEAIGKAYRKFVTEVLQEGVADGSLQLSGPANVIAIALTEMLNSVSRWYDPKGKVKPDAMIEMMVGLVGVGLISRATPKRAAKS